MKKLCIILIVIAQMLLISSCRLFYPVSYFIPGKQNQSENETMEKDDLFIEEIKAIAKEYNYKIENVNLYNEINKREYEITINDEQIISIYLNNSGYKSNTGENIFVICYKTTDKSYLDSDLFVEFANVISGKQITKDEIDEFLSADEEKYPSHRENDALVVKKDKIYNFWEDWILSYTELSAGTTELSFGGLTK